MRALNTHQANPHMQSSFRSACKCKPFSSPTRQLRFKTVAATSNQQAATSRRELVANLLLAAGAVALVETAPARAGGGIEVMSDEPGYGKHAVQKGDLVLIHYTGTLPDGQVFDSTRGGIKYRDGGLGVFRPVVVRLSGAPQPGICEGLQQALIGLTIGGKRVVKVPSSLGFGGSPVLAPYAMVPGGSELTYDIELVRVSSVGPDLLVKGISRCGAGGASATADNCANIQPAEFF